MDIPDYSTDFPFAATIHSFKNKTFKDDQNQKGKNVSNFKDTLEPPLYHNFNVIEIAFILLIGATTAIGNYIQNEPPELHSS